MTLCEYRGAVTPSGAEQKNSPRRKRQINLLYQPYISHAYEGDIKNDHGLKEVALSYSVIINKEY